MAILHLYIPEHGLPADPDALLAFALRSKTGELLKSGQMPLRELPRGERVEAILPACAVLTTELKLPPARGQKLRQMLPFAVEEKLLTDPETTHVAAGPRQLSGLTPVLVVDKPWLQSVIDGLQKAGLRPDRIITETSLPELEPEAWTLVWNGHDGFVRTGPHTGLALDVGDASGVPLALGRALVEAKAKAQAPDRIILRVAGEAPIPDLKQWSSGLELPIVRGHDWDWAPRFVNLDHAINLLQGEFTPFASVRELIPQLRPVWAMALVILAVQVIATGVDWWLLSREKRALTVETERTFRQAFPEAKVVVDAPLQMRRNLAELRRASGQADASDFLPLVGDAVSLLNSAGSGKVQAIKYESGALKLDVTLPNDASLESLRAQLENRRVPARIEASTPKGDGVSARVALGAAVQ